MRFNMLGDANHAGPVRLSDTYDKEVGGAQTGIAASQKALYDAYNSLNSRLLYTQSLTTTSKSIAAGETADTSADAAKSGYTPIGIIGWQSFSTFVFMYNCRLIGNTVKCGLRNYASSQQSGSMIITVLYKKN